jgi:hypothetical protein
MKTRIARRAMSPLGRRLVSFGGHPVLCVYGGGSSQSLFYCSEGAKVANASTIFRVARREAERIWLDGNSNELFSTNVLPSYLLLPGCRYK